MRQLLFLVALIAATTNVLSQEDDRKNTVYVNLTHRLIFDNAYIIGYERVLSKNRSFTFNIGSMALPRFRGDSDNDTVQLTGNSGNKGFHIGGDYRFYLSKENKYEAPRGVYLAPFYSFNYAKRSNQWNLNTASFNGDVSTDISLSIHTAGLQLGYQFILWERLAIDLVLLGPGLGFYNVKASINTTLSAEQESLFFERLNAYLGEKIPGYDLVIDEGDFNKDGSVQTSTVGYRYMINIGYRF